MGVSVDKALAKKIIDSKYEPINSKDSVRIYSYDGKRYFVRCYRHKNTVNKMMFNRLFSFELLRHMGVNIPNLFASLEYTSEESREMCLFSEDCVGKPIGGIDVDNSSIDDRYHKDISRMVYIADLFNFSDIAKDNIFIVDNDKLVLIDFDYFGVNDNFPPVNVFDENYSVSNSFDVHTSKGIHTLTCKVVLATTPSNNIKISNDDKSEIEEKFFSIDENFLKQLSHKIKEKYFCGWKELKFNEESIDEYIEKTLSRIYIVKNQKLSGYLQEASEPSEEYRTLKRAIPTTYCDDDSTSTQEIIYKEESSLFEKEEYYKIESSDKTIEDDVLRIKPSTNVDYFLSRSREKKSLSPYDI